MWLWVLRAQSQASLLTCSSLSRRPCSSLISRFRVRVRSLCSASRTGTEEHSHHLRSCILPALFGAQIPTHSPATLRTLGVVGDPGEPSVQVCPSEPSTRPVGQLQVKLPAVLWQRCEQKVTPVRHSSTSKDGEEESAEWVGRAVWGAHGGAGGDTHPHDSASHPSRGRTRTALAEHRRLRSGRAWRRWLWVQEGGWRMGPEVWWPGPAQCTSLEA